MGWKIFLLWENCWPHNSKKFIEGWIYNQWVKVEVSTIEVYGDLKCSIKVTDNIEINFNSFVSPSFFDIEREKQEE